MFIDRQNPKKHKYTSCITLTYLGSQLGKVNGTTRQLIMFFGFYPQLPNLKAHPTAHNLNMSQKKSKSKIIHDASRMTKFLEKKARVEPSSLAMKIVAVIDITPTRNCRLHTKPELEMSKPTRIDIRLDSQK